LIALAVLVAPTGCGGGEPGEAHHAHMHEPEAAAEGAFATAVAPVLDARCAGCHGPMGAANGLMLGPSSQVAASDIVAGLVGVPSRELPSMALVAAGRPEESFLLHKMENTHANLGCPGGSCQNRMPPAGPPVPDTDIEAVRSWVEAGAKAD
jgi:hypothetical protein